MLTPSAGERLPAAGALLSFKSADGVLTSEVGVEAFKPARSGLILVEQTVASATFLFFVNTAAQPTQVDLFLRDSAGSQVAQLRLTLNAREKRNAILAQLFPSLPAVFRGTLGYNATQNLAVLALLETPNSRGEPIYAALPLLDNAELESGDPLLFSEVAVGDGFSTRLLLLNGSSTRIASGLIRLVQSNGAPLAVRVSGSELSEISYRIEPLGSYSVELEGVTGLQSGYAVVTRDSSAARPSGSSVLRAFGPAGLISQTAVTASRATRRARLFVDNDATRTGLAVANNSASGATVRLDLLDRNGTLLGSTTIEVGAQGQRARYVHELFPELPDGFSGILEASSNVPVGLLTLKLTTNQRGELILTTLPVADLDQPSAGHVLAHLVFGPNLSSRLILLGAPDTGSVRGRISFYQDDGSALPLSLAGELSAQVNFQVGAGARQYRPGNTATPRQIVIDLLAPDTSEIAVNEGSRVQLRPTVIDSDGVARDDFAIQYSSISDDIATVDADGSIEGRKTGFSTLTLSSGVLVATATATITRVTAGTVGFEITGVAQDLARRVYLSDSVNHIVLLSRSLAQAPELWAGLPRKPGFKDDARENSQFRSPAFLAVDQADGSLYVADSGNNVIRRVHPESGGRVETLSLSSRLNNPQGVALDGRGNLWVADSGSHTIRRIDLVSGQVELVAGSAGSSGFADGRGQQARFNAPTGLAVEIEPLALLLERERTGAPPPPVSVVVADSGNGRLRRVFEDGRVETIGATASSSSGAALTWSVVGRHAAAATVFRAPGGVAVDASGNIYVSEPGSGEVKTVLRDGSVVSAAQPGTFTRPRGLVFSESGKIVVAEGNRAAREIAYGAPKISSVTPARISSRGGATVTLQGKNFAPGTIVVLAGTVIRDARFVTTETLTFIAPALPSGRTTLSVQNRGGLAQTALLIDPIPLRDLPAGHITTIAGGTTFSGDGGSATQARLAAPEQIAPDALGNLYIADSSAHKIRRVDATTGIITSVAGRGTLGFAGDGGPAIAAALTFPAGVAVDKDGNLLIADTANSRIRRVDATSAIITTVAGSDRLGFSGDGGPATSARLNSPRGLAVDPGGNLLIADSSNHRIRRVDATSAIITTIAGTGDQSYNGDNRPARLAALASPRGVAVDGDGHIYIADTFNNRIRRIDAASGAITTLDGIGLFGLSLLSRPWSVAVDGAGNLYYSDSGNHRVRKLVSGTRSVVAVAGTGVAGFSGDEGPATAAQLRSPFGVAVDGAGNLFIADVGNARVRRVSAEEGTIRTVAGNGQTTFEGDNAPAAFASLSLPQGIALDRSGNIYVADTANHRVRRIDGISAIITTVAGTGLASYFGDGGQATAAALNFPAGLALDNAGNLYIADNRNHRIRRVDVAGVIATVAGSGIPAFSGDGGRAVDAALLFPSAVAFDASGNLVISDSSNNRIRSVDSQGIIRTIAGNGASAFSGDGGPATGAGLNSPGGVAFDLAGNMYLADSSNGRVRRVDSNGAIVTVAANLDRPTAVAVDLDESLLVFHFGLLDSRIRRIAGGIISTVAGTGTGGFSGDGGPATAAQLFNPIAGVVDSEGNLYFVDNGNDRVRAIRGPVR